jgi:hypothetical protein
MVYSGYGVESNCLAKAPIDPPKLGRFHSRTSCGRVRRHVIVSAVGINIWPLEIYAFYAI